MSGAPPLASPQFPYYARLLLRTLDEQTRGIIALAAEFSDTSPEDLVWQTLMQAAKDHGERLAEEFPAETYARMVRVAAALRRPAPSRQRIEESVAAQKEKYLQAMWDSASPYEALTVAEISMSTPYMWARTDPEFMQRWNEARSFCGMRDYKPRYSRDS